MDCGPHFWIAEEEVGQNRATLTASKLRELNSYVAVEVLENPSQLADIPLDFLKSFSCVVLTETSIETQLRVNQFCRQHNISFIAADTFGITCCAFVDFGKEFVVTDIDGESPLEDVVGKLTQTDDGIVIECATYRLHGLSDGDWVKFREIEGSSELNSGDYEVKILSPNKFCLKGDVKISPYVGGGLWTQVKKPMTMSFQSLEEQLAQPEYLIADLKHFDAPFTLHCTRRALSRYLTEHPNEPADVEAVLALSKELASEQTLDEGLVRLVTATSPAVFAPYAAFLGGFVGQEVLKAISHKFTPLKQWLYLDCREVAGPDVLQAKLELTDRQSGHRLILGAEVVDQIANSKLFMIGAGAIGCEMMKNFATLGVSTGPSGSLVITDNDVIEKSNLNRQFLFRPMDIKQAKSKCAAAATLRMNPQMKITANLDKVCKESENVYSG